MKMVNTVIWLIAVAQAAPATPSPSVKMKMGSKIILSTVPNAATVMGNFVSPSPTSMERKKADKTMKGKPIQITRK